MPAMARMITAMAMPAPINSRLSEIRRLTREDGLTVFNNRYPCRAKKA
jgi:hypothetical protein